MKRSHYISNNRSCLFLSPFFPTYGNTHRTSYHISWHMNVHSDLDRKELNHPMQFGDNLLIPNHIEISWPATFLCIQILHIGSDLHDSCQRSNQTQAGCPPSMINCSDRMIATVGRLWRSVEASEFALICRSFRLDLLSFTGFQSAPGSSSN
jgi:hypothetical protein